MHWNYFSSLDLPLGTSARSNQPAVFGEVGCSCLLLRFVVSAFPLTAHDLFKALAEVVDSSLTSYKYYAESVRMGRFVVMASPGSFVHALDCYYAIAINDLDYYYQY